MSPVLPDLIGLRTIGAEAIVQILKTARSFRSMIGNDLTPKPEIPQLLTGKTVVLYFSENSTRTRLSFEVAIQLLGGRTIAISPSESSQSKGESLIDTVQNIAAMGVHGFVVRHPNAGVPQFIADNLSIPVINAGDGFCEHPTQGLLDMMTMTDDPDELANARVLILGDIAHSRVARSNIWGLLALGASVFVCGPPMLVPRAIAEWGVTITADLDSVIGRVDFINVLRVQHERQDRGYLPSVREYRRWFCLTQARMDATLPHTRILHPGPINRGIEMDSTVVDGSRSVILDQVTNGVAVRMAVLGLIIGAHA